MKYKNAVDMHIHTDNSPDGEHGIMLLCEYAMRIPLRAVTVTDHCEVDDYISGRYYKSNKQSFFDAAKARSIFEGRLRLLCGIELVQPGSDFELADRIVSSYRYDMILASVHSVPSYKDFYYLDYTLQENEPYKLMGMYFDEVLSLVLNGNFDVLAHLTYPLRYIIGRDKIELDMGRFSNITDEILSNLAKNEKALEINTSGLRGDLQKLMPDEKYIRRFKELGGKYITVGSDAHRADDVGAGIEEGMGAALAAGFDRVTMYIGRKPFTVDIK